MGSTREGWIKRKANGNGIPWNKGLTKSDPRVAANSSGHSEKIRGRKFSDEINAKKGRKGHPVSVETRKKISDSKRGDKHHFWKGGITDIHKKIRQSAEYKLWRTAVFTRDNWTCVWCYQVGVRLNADHIKPFAYYPELRFAIDNGRTLCEPCHRKTDTYGRHKNER